MEIDPERTSKRATTKRASPRRRCREAVARRHAHGRAAASDGLLVAVRPRSPPPAIGSCRAHATRPPARDTGEAFAAPREHLPRRQGAARGGFRRAAGRLSCARWISRTSARRVRETPEQGVAADREPSAASVTLVGAAVGSRAAAVIMMNAAVTVIPGAVTPVPAAAQSRSDAAGIGSAPWTSPPPAVRSLHAAVTGRPAASRIMPCAERETRAAVTHRRAAEGQ